MDQKHPKIPKAEGGPFFSLVTTTVISRHSGKMSMERFKFLGH